MLTVKVTGLPVQPCGDVGVTVIVPVMLLVVLLPGAVHGEIFPFPEAPRPIPVLLFVQAKVVPVRLLENAGTVMVAAGQILIDDTPDITTFGYTATFPTTGTLLHPPNVEVIV